MSSMRNASTVSTVLRLRIEHSRKTTVCTHIRTYCSCDSPVAASVHQSRRPHARTYPTKRLNVQIFVYIYIMFRTTYSRDQRRISLRNRKVFAIHANTVKSSGTAVDPRKARDLTGISAQEVLEWVTTYTKKDRTCVMYTHSWVGGSTHLSSS